MKQKVFLFILMSSLLLVFFACQDSTDANKYKVKFQPVTNLTGFVVDSTTAGLTWNRSVDEARGDFASYLISAIKPDGNIEKTVNAAKGEDSVMITNLQKNLIYTFKVVTKVSTLSQNGIDSDPVAVNWCPGWVRLQPITNLMSFSVSNTSIGFKWTKSANETHTDFMNYVIKVAKPNKAIVKEITVPKSTDSIIVTGLENGVIYSSEITAYASPTSLVFTASDVVKIKWAPAWRFDAINTNPINVYETSSSPDSASGLILYDPVTKQTKTEKLLGIDSVLIDLYVHTVPDTLERINRLAVRSSHLFRKNRRILRISTVSYNSETLNNPQVAPPDTATYSLFEFRVDSLATPTSRIHYFRARGGKDYGRLLIMRNPENGTLLWGTSPSQYLRFQVSYQTVPENIYSKTNK
ncbi:MAG: fibronectin type III domain-containing protein [Bacteroidota bacterium]|nr:fibronectin type III domain-containing protein [Bacteroidota bacterium]